MKNFQLKQLQLVCKDPDNIFSYDIGETLVIHGKIASGKSSFVRLLNYALGGEDFEETVALQRRFDSVRLVFNVEEVEYICERRSGSKKIQLSKIQEGSAGETPLVLPIIKRKKLTQTPPKEESFSDYILSNLDLPKEDNVDLQDLLNFCYLKQEELDSSFFGLNNNAQALRSMRFILGYDFREEKNLQFTRDKFISDKKKEEDNIKGWELFLPKIGFPLEVTSYEKIEEKLKLHIKKLRDELKVFFDPQRKNVQSSEELKSTNIRELNRLIHKRKLELQQVDFAKNRKVFVSCPSCKKALPERAEEECNLCLQTLTEDDSSKNQNLRSSREINDEILKLEAKKSVLEESFKEDLSYYTPNKISQRDRIVRELGKEEHRLEIARLNKNKLNVSIKSSEDMIEKTIPLIKASQDTLKEYQGRIKNINEKYMKDFFDLFIDCLKRCEIIERGVEVTGSLSTTDYIPYFKLGSSKEKISYYNIGSGGQKVAFKSCYALALHRLAAKYDLRIPKILIIDTPTKNIGEIVNENICQGFYRLISELKEDELKGTQMIIIDKEYPFEKEDFPNLSLREMSVGNSSLNKGPLISDFLH